MGPRLRKISVAHVLGCGPAVLRLRILRRREPPCPTVSYMKRANARFVHHGDFPGAPCGPSLKSVPRFLTLGGGSRPWRGAQRQCADRARSASSWTPGGPPCLRLLGDGIAPMDSAAPRTRGAYNQFLPEHGRRPYGRVQEMCGSYAIRSGMDAAASGSSGTPRAFGPEPRSNNIS